MVLIIHGLQLTLVLALGSGAPVNGDDPEGDKEADSASVDCAA